MSEICIIGAGPAGSLAAILLARRGVPVTLIEQHQLPRHKVCGECLSALAIDTLAQADLLNDIRGAGPVTITHFSLYDRAGRSITLPLPRPMLGLSRFALDQILLDRARSDGAVVLQPARCEAIQPSDASVAIRDLTTNRVQSLTPRIVLLADGRSALFNPPRPTRDFGLKAHFADIDLLRRAIHLFGFNGHYGGLAPIENGFWNLAFSVPAERIRACPNLDDLLCQIIDENPALAAAMRHARRITPLLACPLQRFGLRRTWPENLIPLGNAACSIEPIGGEGMGLALASAAVAAPLVADAIAENRPMPAAQLQQMFGRLWLTRRPACRLAALAFSHDGLSSAATRLLSSAASFRELLLNLMGKAKGAADARRVTEI